MVLPGTPDSPRSVVQLSSRLQRVEPRGQPQVLDAPLGADHKPSPPSVPASTISVPAWEGTGPLTTFRSPPVDPRRPGPAPSAKLGLR
ncbi:hypothetical protein NDU88_000795 [Pleurodeles waltl]|uniref:Uncharacterized protein n=1 Tax=Pleurodeles waltl TaxID=8319 RepID=A0AAV7VXM2_PLEWA|nr:hypothetical protein NDU88_000795 [Pleurodeles waltl]